jgi:peptidoglycan hydrolase CwlO-like protein
MCSFGLSFGFATYSFFSTKNYRSQLNKNFKEWTIDIKEESSSLKKSIDEVKGIISNPDSNGNSLTDNISEMESILENLSEGERIELEVLEDLKNSTEEIKKKSDSIDKRIAKIEGFNQNIHLKNDDIESKIKK